MALTHNVIIRGMNSIYLQCEHITLQNASSFLLYCQCWAEFIQNHHACEEVAYFPIIEKAVGVEGLSEGNLEQHEAFLAGLQDFENYVYHVPPNQYSGNRITTILESFAATLQSHLTDEVVWIMALSRYQNLDLAAIDNYHKDYVRAKQNSTRLVPFLLTNHDIFFEAGIHAAWPILSGPHTNTDETPGLGARIRNLWIRYVCTLSHRHAWKYSSCTIGGKPKALEGPKQDSAGDLRPRDRGCARGLASGHGSEDCLQKPGRVIG